MAAVVESIIQTTIVVVIWTTTIIRTLVSVNVTIIQTNNVAITVNQIVNVDTLKTKGIVAAIAVVIITITNINN